MNGETYEEFVEKFKPKKTTDDCMTPSEVYEIVKDWAREEYGIDEEKIVRPFWPGGDYENYDYPEGCVVLDNPPFSIVRKITNDYVKNGIRFFLFAPGKTLLSSRKCLDVTSIIVDVSITYTNGACVNTGFVTNLENGVVLRTSVALSKRLREHERKNRKGAAVASRHIYPKNVISAARFGRYSHFARDVKIHRKECKWVRSLDEQKGHKTASGYDVKIYGGGLYISDQKAEELEKIEEEGNRILYHKWNLSQREQDIVDALSEEPKG